MRRSAGEGAVLKRKDGLWRVAVQVHGKRRYLYAKTRKGVVEKLRGLQQRVARGETIEPARMTVGDYLERWLADAVKPARRIRTYESHDYVRRRLIVPYLAKVRMDKLTALDVQRMLSSLGRAGKSAVQQQAAYVTLHAALEQAVRWDLLATNPVTKVTRPRIEEKEPRALTPEEVRTLLDAAVDDPYEALVTVMVYCGLRWGESVGLKWGDVDFRRRLLSVRRAVEETNEGVRMGELKSRAARRSVAMPRDVVDALKRHREALGAMPTPTRLIFTDAAGGMLRRGNFGRRHWRPMREAAGLDGVRVHDLRHTAATLALRAGSDPKTLQTRLGHSSAAFTLQRYGHAIEDAQREVADRLDELIRRGD